MKRFVYMLLTMVLTLSLVACDNSQDQTEDNGTSTSKTTETTVAKEGDSVLIAYFTAAENSGVDVTSSKLYNCKW